MNNYPSRKLTFHFHYDAWIPYDLQCNIRTMKTCIVKLHFNNPQY